MRSFLVATITILLGTTLLASTPPTTPTRVPLLRLSAPIPIVLPPHVGPFLPWTVERISQLPISPSVATVWINAILNAQPASLSPRPSEVASGEETLSQGVQHTHRLLAKPETSPGAVLQPAYDNPVGPREQEPVLVTETFGSPPTEDRTLAAFMRWNGCCPLTGPARIYTKSTGGSGGGQVHNLDSLYPNTGDPWVSENPSIDPNTNKPLRMYVVGTDFNNNHLQGSRLEMWYTDDGGRTMSSRNLIWDEPTTSAWFADKPSVDVSWYYGTRGYVYAVTARVDVESSPDANPNQLLVFRSTDGVNFGPPTAVLSLNSSSPAGNPLLPDSAPTSPQIVVDYETGDVYIIWLDWKANTIYAARSNRDAMWFTLLPSIKPGQPPFDQLTFLGPGSDMLTGTGYQIEARSMLNARYNGVALYGVRYIGVTWHVRQRDNIHTDVEFAALTTTTPASWAGPSTVNELEGTALHSDQWNPALDYDGVTGNWLVSYYDRRDDPMNTYRMYATKLDTVGNRVDLHDTAVTASPNPAADPQLGVQASAGVYGVGEYHGLWYWSGKWRACHIYAPVTTHVGVYFSDILSQP